MALMPPRTALSRQSMYTGKLTERSFLAILWLCYSPFSLHCESLMSDKENLATQASESSVSTDVSVSIPVIEEKMPSSLSIETDSAISVIEGDLLPGKDQFKLLRVFVIDSLPQGRIVEMRIDGGTVLTGDNGKGKTSLLQLIPFFYGTNPNRIVGRLKELSFIEYYLPNSTSHLAFEYQLPDGAQRMVVAYANSTGEKIFYRFIRQGYDRRIFIDENEAFVSGANLRKRLTFLGIKASRTQIETYSEYKAIIQRSKSRSGDKLERQRWDELTADYAFTNYNKPLSNVDNLVFGMFSRESDFEVLKSIIIESLYPNENSSKAGTQRSSIESWPAKYRAYMSVMDAQDSYLEASDVLNKIKDNVRNLGGLHEQVELLIGYFKDEENKQKRSLQEEKHGLKALETAYRDASNDLARGETESKVRIETTEHLLKELDENKAEYDRLDIPAKQIHYNQRGVIKQEIDGLNKRKDAMTNEHLPIMARYEMMEAKRTNQHAKDVAMIAQEIDKSRDSADEKLTRLSSSYKVNDERFEAARVEMRATVQAEVEEHIKRVEGFRQNMRNPQVDEELIASLDKSRNLSKSRRQTYDKLHNQSGDIERAARKAADEHSKFLLRVDSATGEIAKLEEEIKKIIRDNTPKEGTLLFKLRAERPDWGQDIARVLRPDILHRTDLDPVLSEGAGVYGLDLNIENLPPCPESNPEYLAQLVEDENRRLEKMVDRKNGMLKTLASLARDLKDKEKVLVEHKSELLDAKSRMQSADAETEKAEIAYKMAKEQSVELAKARYDEAEKNLKLSRESIDMFDQEHRKQLKARQLELAEREEVVRKERDSVMGLLRQREGEAQARYQDDLERYADERNSLLESKGLDKKSLEDIDAKIKEAEIKLKAASDLRDLLGKWVTWFRDSYSKRDIEADKLTQEKETLAQILNRIALLDQKFDVESKFLIEKITVLEKRIQDLVDDHTRAVSMEQRLEGFNTEQQYDEVDPSWSIESLSSLMNTWSSDLKKNNRELDKIVSGLKRKFESTPHSTVFKEYDSYRNNHEIDGSRDMMLFFDDWYSHLHEESFKILYQTAHLFVDGMRSFHDNLKSFSTKLAGFNRDLQKHLGRSSEYFADIRELDVEIYSTVDEIKGWAVIKAIAESDRSWMQNNRLPEMDFVNDLERLLDQWDVKNGISADYKSLVGLRGSVIENGRPKRFRNSNELNNISSNGLSYIILILLFIAFWNKIRKDSPVNLVWALDELGIISKHNIGNMMRLLADNNVTLVSASPDTDVATLSHFDNPYILHPDRRLAEVQFVPKEEASHV